MAIETTTPLSPGDPRLPERYWDKVEVDASGCWLWTGTLKEDGYARYGRGGETYVHRLAYEAFIGPIPPQFQVDHACHDATVCKLGDLCLHRRCVNPEHLRALTPRDNALRSGCPAAFNPAKTHCPQGHPYDDANTAWLGRKRRCRICRAVQARAASLRYLAKRKAAA